MSDTAMANRAEPTGATTKRAARRFVVLMSVVALFGDMTTEGARGLVGPYLTLLGASAITVGFAAGLGEFLGYGLGLFTGWLSDRTRAHWPLVSAGYGTNLIAVPGLAHIGSWEAAVALLLLERIGKTVRSPARSTLVSYAASEADVGKSFGLEEASWVVRGESVLTQYRVASAVLLLPVVLDFALVLAVRSKFRRPASLERAERRDHPHRGALFRWYVVGVMLVGLGFADWALLAFHAGRTGALDAATLPLLCAGAMAVDALGALAFGALFDRYVLLVLAATTTAVAQAVWGISRAMAQRRHCPGRCSRSQPTSAQRCDLAPRVG